LEVLEGRIVLNGSAVNSPHFNFREYHDASHIPAGLTPSTMGILPQDNGSSFPSAYTPDVLQAAYGFTNIMFGSTTGDGTGQTIAIVDAYDDPKFLNSTDTGFATSDLAEFDLLIGIADPPSFTKVNQSGQSSPLPKTDPAGAGNVNGNWEIEEALDIEYAHGMAPGANIVLVEANSGTNADLFAAVATAAGLPGVSAVSMSWGTDEYTGENLQDTTFVTSKGHQGVSFLASSGDNGGYAYTGATPTTPGILYPAASPNVIAVGGTTLQLNADNSIFSETAWSGSGGGTSLLEKAPTYQLGVQQTGQRTIPDVAFDADPNTGVSVYDSYNNIDASGPWVTVGGTSVGAPAWSGMIAIVNQGRVLAGASTLDGPNQTLPALYAISPTDFNDITSGGNGVFNAGLGYDEVTGIGSPRAVDLADDLSTYGTATQMMVTAQPPSQVIVGDGFGVVVAAENSKGGVDPAFNGTLSISLDSNHPGATLGGTLSATAVDGVAVFDGLTLNKTGTGYTFTITSSQFPSITTIPFNMIPNPTPWQGTFYPVPTDASLRAAIKSADTNSFAFNTIDLAASTYLLTNASSGGIVITNSTLLRTKSLTITGQGEASSVIGSAFNWRDRIFEIVGSATHSQVVTLQDLAIEGGDAQGGGILGGSTALGGGVLVDNAAVTLANDLLNGNQAQGAIGAAGIAGVAPGGAGGGGGNANGADGGGIYLASGTLSLFSDTFNDNVARGGIGGQGGVGGGQGAKSSAGVRGGLGGFGGRGGAAAGGAIYAANGTLRLENDSFNSNQAVGGLGGPGGTGGSGGHGGHTGGHGGAGGVGGAASGGAIYLAGGSLTVMLNNLKNDAATGGIGGSGGHGGPGTAAGGSLTAILGGVGSTLLAGLTHVGVPHGGNGGMGGAGGAGGAASGGGIYVKAGSLTMADATLSGEKAIGGQGGLGGQGGTGGFSSAVTPFAGIPIGKTGGAGGAGGNGGLGEGGGIQVAGGAVIINASTLNGNVASGGSGGAGGLGGYGPVAAVYGGTVGITTPGIGATTAASLGGGVAKNTAGPGGNGGNGGNGYGGGLYVSGGTLKLFNATVAENTVQPGASGSGGAGGKAGTGKLTGGLGSPGLAGASSGGGLYVSGGTVKIDNSTVALNIDGSGSAGGVAVVSLGTVTAASTIFAGNGAVDFSGAVSATNSLFQTSPTGTLSGSGNRVNVDPLLDTKGLQINGGATQTIALQANSPAIGAGINPDNLFADQRGYGPRKGPSGVDIGAYQTNASADMTAPTAVLKATAVTTANALALKQYTFTVTYSDNVAVSAATLAGAVVQVLPPGAKAPIAVSVVSTKAVGATDGAGNAGSFIVTYKFTAPGGTWKPASDGVYTVTLGGGPVTDLAGNALAAGTLGTFSVQV
jgi:hypothetical protein